MPSETVATWMRFSWPAMPPEQALQRAAIGVIARARASWLGDRLSAGAPACRGAGAPSLN